MKLLLCTECQDVFKLSTKRVRKCACGKTRGKYEIDGLHAWYSGPAMPLGFANSSLAVAMWEQQNHDDAKWGKDFKAFVIPQKCDTFIRKPDGKVRPSDTGCGSAGKSEEEGGGSRGQGNQDDRRLEPGSDERNKEVAALRKFKVTGDLKDCPLVRCNKCGWVHFAVTWVYALRQTCEFNQWFRKQPKETQDCYHGESNIDTYLKCFRCGGDYKDTREAKPKECPSGSTIQPILHYSESVPTEDDDEWLDADSDWPYSMI